MGGIFISYRRSDVSGYAHALHAQLSQRFGAAQIFMDIDSIEPGMDFVEAIEKALDSASVTLVLIGKRWYQPERLQDPMDLVRLEIAMALDRRMRIIPVFFENTLMPKPDELPETIRALTRKQAVDVSDLRFNYDVGRLSDFLTRIINEPSQAPLVPHPGAMAPQVAGGSEAKPGQSNAGTGNYIEPALVERATQKKISNEELAAQAEVTAGLRPPQAEVAHTGAAEGLKIWITKSWANRKARKAATEVFWLCVPALLACIVVDIVLANAVKPNDQLISTALGIGIVILFLFGLIPVFRYIVTFNRLKNGQWAVDAFRADRWVETEEAVRWLISHGQQSRHAWAYGVLGTLYSREGKYADAEEAFRRSASLGPE